MALPDMLSMFESLRLDMQDLYWRGSFDFLLICRDLYDVVGKISSFEVSK